MSIFKEKDKQNFEAAMEKPGTKWYNSPKIKTVSVSQTIGWLNRENTSDVSVKCR